MFKKLNNIGDCGIVCDFGDEVNREINASVIKLFHYVKKEVDSGSIIIQAAVPLKKEDSKETLKKRIQNMEHIILPIAIAKVANKIRTNFKDKK